MAEDLHAFITGTLWLKLQADTRDLRLFNKHDLIAAAYFHIRRLLLIQPGWTCRIAPDTAAAVPDLVLLYQNTIRALMQLEFLLKPREPGYFPANLFDQSMRRLRQMVTNWNVTGRGYLVGVFDSAEPWLFPDEADPRRQTCFWLPVNCHNFPDHVEWRQKWENLARILGCQQHPSSPSR